MKLTCLNLPISTGAKAEMFHTGMCPSHSGQMKAGTFGDAERSNKSELKNATARTSIFFPAKKTCANGNS